MAEAPLIIDLAIGFSVSAMVYAVFLVAYALLLKPWALRQAMAVAMNMAHDALARDFGYRVPHRSLLIREQVARFILNPRPQLAEAAWWLLDAITFAIVRLIATLLVAVVACMSVLSRRKEASEARISAPT
jgi:hypothetical protein